MDWLGFETGIEWTKSEHSINLAIVPMHRDIAKRAHKAKWQTEAYIMPRIIMCRVTLQIENKYIST